MRARQRELAEDAVLEGRDTGSRRLAGRRRQGVPGRLRGRARAAARRRARRPTTSAPSARRSSSATAWTASSRAGGRRDGDRHGRPDAEQVVERIVSLARPPPAAKPSCRRHASGASCGPGPGRCSGRAADPHAGRRERAPLGPAAPRREPPVAVGHPRDRPAQPRAIRYMAKSELFRATAVRRVPADGRHVRRAPGRARPGGAADGARDGRGRRLRRHLHPGPPPGRARGGQGRRRPDARWSRTRPSCRWRSGSRGWRPGQHDLAWPSGRRAGTSAATAGPRRRTGRPPTS